ncbi:MAG: flagellar basal-body rod protein FlgF [Deltaproteobacteria bacterium]
MSDGLYAALARAVASERALEIVANNVANVGTTGFRGERVAFTETVARAQATQVAGRAPVPQSLRYTEIAESRIDTTQGPLRQTGNPLDLAISGDAYFAVDTPEGARFTRDGSFVVGSDGVLRTRQGFAVRGAGALEGPASPITIPPAASGGGLSSVSVASDGTLSTETQVIGQLALYRFERPSDLSPESGSLLVASDVRAAVEAPGAQVVSGFLEGANVGPITGMNDLISASRSFEAFQRVIQSFRSLDERAARDLAGGG